MMLEMLDSIYNKLYEYAVLPKFKSDLEEAEKIFVMNDDKEDIEGFTEWFIFNNRSTKNQKRLIETFTLNGKDEQIEENVKILNGIKKSFRSLFSVTVEYDKAILKDIFTQHDYILENMVFEENQLVCARVVEIDHCFYIVGDIFEFEISFKEAIKKYILDQYNQFSVINGVMSVEDFLDLNGYLLYKILRIIQTIEEENAFDEDLMLFQATYGYVCAQELLYEKLLDLPIMIIADEDEEPILRVIEEDIIVAEIEIEEKMFHILCNNEQHLHEMIKTLEMITNAEIVYLKTEKYTLEDLL